MITLMRTRVGADETVFMRYFLMNGLQFQNFDDTSYVNFYASSVFGKMARVILRPSQGKAFGRDIDRAIERCDESSAFIFNGRGINKSTAKTLSKLEKVYWYLPDFLPHREHRHIEEISSKIFFTKPEAYNVNRFLSAETRSKIENIYPTIFSQENEKRLILEKYNSSISRHKDVDLVFLGNHSKFKELQINEIASLTGRKISIVGGGWKSSTRISALGPIYGPSLEKFLSRAKIGIAIPDSRFGKIDPVTVRYFQYPLFGTLGIYFSNHYNRSLLYDGLEEYCFENFVEAVDRINGLLKLDQEKYFESLKQQIYWLNRHATSAEYIYSKLL